MATRAKIIAARARAIAKVNGDDYDTVPKSKSEWVAERGEFNGRYRDVNEPFQGDYIEQAEATLAADEAMGLVLVPAEPVAWRYISPAPAAKWTVQKNYPADVAKWEGYRIEGLAALSDTVK